MTIGTRLFTMLRGAMVGTDTDGNRYYLDKRAAVGGRRKRWVLYHGTAEASKVPPDWHAWLHYTIDEPPSVRPLPSHPWERRHQANPTGTPEAQLPSGHPSGNGRRQRATGDYEPWKPA